MASSERTISVINEAEHQLFIVEIVRTQLSRLCGSPLQVSLLVKDSSNLFSLYSIAAELEESYCLLALCFYAAP